MKIHVLLGTGQEGNQNQQPQLIQQMMATPNHHGTGTAGGHHQQFGTGDGHPSTSSLSQTHSVNLMMLNSNQPSAAASSDGLPNNQLLNSSKFVFITDLSLLILIIIIILIDFYYLLIRIGRFKSINF